MSDRIATCFAIGLASVLACVPVAAQTAPTSTSKPSFDCTKAATKIEKLICSSVEVSQLDAQMASAYAQARKNLEPKYLGQVAWLKDTRNQCGDVSCLASAYKDRNEGLQRLASGVYYASTVPSLSGILIRLMPLATPHKYELSFDHEEGIVNLCAFEGEITISSGRSPVTIKDTGEVPSAARIAFGDGLAVLTVVTTGDRFCGDGSWRRTISPTYMDGTWKLVSTSQIR